MNKGIIKCLKNSIGEKGNYCYSLPVETTKAVIKELNRLNNIINELEKFLNKVVETGSSIEQITCKNILNYLQELKENNNNG